MGKIMVVRKVADRSEGERIRVPVTQSVELPDGTVVEQATGVHKLVDPTTPGDGHEPWPLLGVRVDDPPDTCRVPTSWVSRAAAEGWLTLVNPRVVHRPGGPPHDAWAVTHTFVHADALVLDTLEGELRYAVIHQPDKYVADGDDDTAMTPEHYAAGNSRVDWFYEIERVA